MNNLKIMIAGGGIGGITAALCLAKYGYKIDVFEQASAFGEVGAGIQLSPNCSRVLHYLGLEAALRERGFLPEGGQFRSWRTGGIISESKHGVNAVEKFGAPYYHIHRGDLLMILVEAATKNPDIELHLNAAVESFTDLGNDGVEVMVGGLAHKCDLLIGADGIRSIVRSGLWGEQNPQYTGNVAWRALVPVDRLPKGLIRPMSTVWWGPHKHFVHYYVRRGEFVNCVCVVEKTGWDVESWTEPGDYLELKADFAGWHSDVQQLIDQADKGSLYKWALYDRPPMSNWGKGRVTLLGDACHPTLPFMAQGAAMAIEDAAVIAGCLDADDKIASSLQRYEALRKDRTAGIQNGSRRNATVFHMSGVKAWFRNRAARTAGNHTTDKLYRYNALSAAKR